MEQILLSNADIIFGAGGKPVWIEVGKNTLHPDVHRAAFQTVKSIQQCTVGNLGADTENFHQFFLGLFQRHRWDGGKVYLT